MNEINEINRAVIACNHAECSGDYTHRLNLWGEGKMNVFPRVTLIKRFFGEFDSRLVDFIEIATFIYVADQMIVRCQNRVDPHGSLWRRDITLIIAVQDYEFWSSIKVIKTLERLLRFLSDDKFTIQFTPMTEPHPEQCYFNFKDNMGHALPPEQVILFSGGLDSLGGAIQEMICDDKRTVLVRHKSSTKHKARYAYLEEVLQKRSANKGIFFTINTGKDSDLTAEYTQRCRSFLYFSLGATIAHLLGLDSLRFYENGPISFNLPMSSQVVGGRATRTTHPQTLYYFQELIRLITKNETFIVSNPFLNLTKSDVVKLIINNGLGELIPYSMSCAHSWQQKTEVQTHCGVCSQCIDRRVAIIAAGAEEYDKREDYLIDFFTQAVDKKVDDFDSPNKNLLTSFFLRGKQIGSEKYSYDDFESDYPMLSDAIPYMNEYPNVAAKNIFQLYQRLATDILAVEKYTLTSPEYIKLAGDLNTPLSPDSLYGILSRGVRTLMEYPEKPAPTPKFMFKRDGDVWRISYNGNANILCHYSGCDYIVKVLGQPNSLFPLDEIDTPMPLPHVSVDKSELISGFQSKDNYMPATDTKSLKEYYAERSRLEALIEEAKAVNDPGTTAECEEELEVINKHLQKCLKTGGKARNLNQTVKRQTDKIRRALKTVRAKIEVFDQDFADHLKECISVGERGICYKPITPILWHIK